MSYVTPSQIEQAKQIDLFTYLQTQEPSELVRISGNTYTTKTHDSLKISNGKWMWWSRGIGGRTALDYLIKVRGLEFTQAVETLTGRGGYIPSTPLVTPPKKKPLKLILPQKNSSNDKVTEYLYSRGIDIEIIQYCLAKGYIFESYPHQNAVFVGMDNKGKLRYGAYRGTGNERFIGDASGSDKNFSFRLVSGTSDTVHLFESAIDLLSYATLLKLKGKDYKGENLLSLAGVYMPKKVIEESKIPKALENFLEENNSVKRVVFHLDNDYAGRIATKAISTVLPKSYETVDKPPPHGKDFNDYLCACLGIKHQSKERRNEPHGR